MALKYIKLQWNNIFVPAFTLFYLYSQQNSQLRLKALFSVVFHHQFLCFQLTLNDDYFFGALKGPYSTSWKTASISKLTPGHFQPRPRSRPLITGRTVTDQRSRKGNPGGSGTCFPERTGSTAMGGSWWPGRAACCPSPWASSSSPVDYSLFLSECGLVLRSTLLSRPLRVQWKYQNMSASTIVKQYEAY